MPKKTKKQGTVSVSDREILARLRKEHWAVLAVIEEAIREEKLVPSIPKAKKEEMLRRLRELENKPLRVRYDDTLIVEVDIDLDRHSGDFGIIEETVRFEDAKQTGMRKTIDALLALLRDLHEEGAGLDFLLVTSIENSPELEAYGERVEKFFEELEELEDKYADFARIQIF